VRLALVLVLLAACGDDLQPTAPCTVSCTDACPDERACVAGMCAVPGTSCPLSFAHVRAGNGFACALDVYGRAWCWGDNTHHQIDATGRAHVDRMTLTGPTQWDSLEVGGAYACGLRGGALACWGANDRGQIDLTSDGDKLAPYEIHGAPARWTSVSTGFQHTCAIGDGRLFCWGAGELGELGTNMANDDIAREPLPAVTDWTAVDAGYHHTCGVSASMGLVCWGDNSHGELGDGTTIVRYQPTPIALSGAAHVAFGLESTCGITDAGALACWGRGDLGELGELPTPDDTHKTPTMASELVGWTRVASAERYACGLQAGEVWCWGAAAGGGLGGGRWADTRAWAPVVTGATDVAVGWNRVLVDSATNAGDLDLACAIVGGDVRCWGDDRRGQLGNGAATQALIPIDVAPDHAWTSIAAGDDHACAVDAAGTSCWGATTRGQIDGTPSGVSPPCVPGGDCDVGAPRAVSTGVAPTALVAGDAHTCAIGGGAIACWGADDAGQCGDDVMPFSSPTIVSGTWTSAVAGADAACATNAAGETWCWGRTMLPGATATPSHASALDGARQIAFGVGFACALDATGALACWGDPAAAAFGNDGPGTCGDGACDDGETAATCAADCGPGPLTHLGRHYQMIALGTATPFGCGLRDDGAIECWGANAHGQALEPDPDTLVLDPVPTPFPVPHVSACTQLVAGGAHACALCGGAIACWGDGRVGQMGAYLAPLPVIDPQVVPAPLDAGDQWAQLAAGATFTCARSTQGHVRCWGFGPHGALGGGALGASLPALVPPP
jgi:alpha-tubulin suppressor-like RCC1 family protein